MTDDIHIVDNTLGFPLEVWGEVLTFDDSLPPTVIINEIYYKGAPIALWCLSDRYFEHLKQSIERKWLMT